MDTRIDPSQLFLTGSALETVCHWSNTLKSFQQRLSPYFVRQEARQAAFNYIQALLSPVALFYHSKQKKISIGS